MVDLVGVSEGGKEWGFALKEERIWIWELVYIVLGLGGSLGYLGLGFVY